ncbi:MAG: hypothetical protein AAFQ80_20940 [Cyanobacteria bacterium J06621_8]
MSQQKIHVHTHTGKDGMVHLDIPLGVVNQDVDLIISYATTDESSPADEELAEILAQAKPSSDLSEYRGTVNLTEEPLAYQQKVRDEW